MRGTRIWTAAYALVVAAFLGVVATYYHPAYGFTAFIEFPAHGHSYELPAVQAAAHYDHPGSGGYDGQFYAQLGVDPLIRSGDLTRALDDPPYRARRILFSWIAYAFGLGRPAWILQAAALENVVGWLVLAWLLWRWIPPTGPRAFVLWAGTLLGHGALMSVRYALPDGLSALLIAVAVLALEQGRPLIAGAVVGAAGLARETALLAAVMFSRLLATPRRWRALLGAGVLAALPLALWMDYLRSIYRTNVLAGGGHITQPFLGLTSEIRSIGAHLGDGFTAGVRDDVTALVAFLAQGCWILWRLIRHRDLSPWTMVGAAFLVLALVAHPVVWDGAPGAYTRVALPLAMGVNVLLARDPRASWWVIALVNLSAIPGVALMLSFAW
jgi:hypothetical protein